MSALGHSRPKELQSELIVSRWKLQALIAEDENVPRMADDLARYTAQKARHEELGAPRQQASGFLQVGRQPDEETSTKARAGAAHAPSFRWFCRCRLRPRRPPHVVSEGHPTRTSPLCDQNERQEQGRTFRRRGIRRNVCSARLSPQPQHKFSSVSPTMQKQRSSPRSSRRGG